MAVLTIQVFGEDQVARELLNFSGRLMEAGPAFAKIHEELQDQVADQFDTEGQRGSGGWEPLKDETLLRKEAAGVDTRILMFSHELRDSLVDSGHSQHVFRISDEVLTFGSDVEYGVFHQKGAPGANLPRRPPVELTERDRVDFVRTLQRWFVDGSLVKP